MAPHYLLLTLLKFSKSFKINPLSTVFVIVSSKKKPADHGNVFSVAYQSCAQPVLATQLR